MKKVLMKTTTPIPTGPTGVCASANGGRMKEKNAPPIITSARLPAIKASNSSETPCALARRRSIREARIRDPDEHNQREDDERDCVEEVEALERLEVMMGGRDDEARNRRAEAETEVACDASERGRCGALLRRNQGQGQDLAGGSHESEAGTADGRADEAL